MGQTLYDKPLKGNDRVSLKGTEVRRESVGPLKLSRKAFAMCTDDLSYVLEMWPISDDTDDHISSHHLLLRDHVRNQAFQRAIHRTVNPGDIVVEIGGGTGILSAFALQAGAKHVYLIESEDVISCAQKILRRGGWKKRITCIRSRAEAVRFTGRRADVIIAELIGSFGVDENILEVVPLVRNRALKRKGTVIPNRLQLFIAPISYPPLEQELELYRSVRHGVDLSPLATLADNNLYMVDLRNAQFLAAPVQLIEFDLLTWSDNTFERSVRFTIDRPGTLIGFAGWFEMSLSEGISLSNEPTGNQTHWDQVIFPIGDPARLKKNDRVSFHLHYETPKGGDEWKWSGTIQSREGKRRFCLSSENRFPFTRISSRKTLRMG